MMRILYIAADPNVSLHQSGGAGTHMRATVRELRRSHTVDTIIGGDLGEQEHTTRNQNKQQHRGTATFLKSIMPVEFRGCVNDLRRFHHYRKMRKEVFRFLSDPANRPDVIYDRAAYGDKVALEAAKEFSLPYVIESDVTLADLKDAGKRSATLQATVARPRERMKLKAAQRVVVMSEQSIELARERWGVSPEKCSVKGLGYDKTDFSSSTGLDLDSEYQLHGKFVVSYVGYFQDYQNIPVLLDAAKHLRSVREIQFLIVGAGRAKLTAQLEEQIRQDELSNVTMTGMLNHEKMGDVYRRIDLGVITDNLPHMYPVKFLEFVAQGITTAVPKYPVFRPFYDSDDDFNSHAFAAGDGAELADIIRNAQMNPTAANDRMEYSRSYVDANNSWAACSQRLEQGLEQAVAEHNGKLRAA